MNWQRAAMPIALGAMVWANQANADEVIATLVNYYVQTTAGASEICGIEAMVVFKNMTDRADDPFPVSKVQIGLNWNEVKGNIGLMYKIGGYDLHSLDGSALTTPYPIKLSDISAARAGTPKPYKLLPCIGQPGWFCSLYWMPDSLALAQEKDLTIRVTRDISGTPLDVSLPLHLLSSSTDTTTKVDMKDFKAFTDCFVEILERAKKVK